MSGYTYWSHGGIFDVIRDTTGDRVDHWDDYRTNLLATRAATADETTRLDELANEEANRTKAAQALTANTTDIGTNDSFLAIASPTNAQIAAQVKELTRQSTRQARELNALIRLVLRRFDSAD